MDDGTLELEMARRSYGYGRWDAPYWFIGPEQGKGPKETADNTPRVNAWLRLDGAELCDCLDFHRLIGEVNWHKARPKPQTTWKPLILLLMAYLERDTNLEALRAYQRDQWGRASSGETCLIELSGLAARSLSVPMDRERFRQERIEIIRQRMDTYKPTLVVMYGDSKERREHWEDVAGNVFPPDKVLKRGPTLIALPPHPASFKLTDLEWKAMGTSLREKSSLS
jgi:hypothetical protein